MKKFLNIKYLLLVMVALIWGVISYRIYAGLSPEEALPEASYEKPVHSSDTSSSYRLLESDYPDPFSNVLPGKNESKEEEDDDDAVEMNQLTASPALQPSVSAISMQPQPSIKYNGYIYDPVTKRKTALVTINGRGITAGVNEKIDADVKVLDINEEKISLMCNGKTMTVLLGGS